MKSRYFSNLLKPLNLLLILFILGLAACTDDDDDSVDNTPGINPNEEELITSIEVIMNDTANATIDTFRFRDPDGDGGNIPVIDSIIINSNTTYLVNLRFLDESDPNDVEDITVEVKDEDDEHLVCYEVTPAMAITINRTDTDGTYELGLESDWQTFGAQSGRVEISLKHQPGVKDGSCSPGETDVQVAFPFRIQ
ncbi:MAG: hypothetical protein CMP59_04370 [Flavobacteriales bacterium]|nr:hypothetical protein [Flavobacteriales bacterium]|tara:strand:- start:777 stop:1361 length:585 start_codon:yes stop_codon:yes gene_type:complete